ncbi:hypothetical protein APB68_24885 [Pseudomonas aeruginosa]|jgi:hypothetical protein|uniref:Uncharacterized protein n=2 Tax=Pseudomonadota TaxID=1224 RepID=A0A6I0DUD8_BRUAN|nr:hypothetical protein PA34_024405 [Pseudomonas aeruginosa]KAB2803366.1 hypothetical protein F9L06_04235 [Brucella anthropi]KSS12967.1 hypothetical protein APB66_24655 [Pseudomonas aeruginosa]KSS62495.1 hypothetical protein APB68_24885 [Pseudomonas aeruginosa]MCO1977056.1 hypothetical protein [Pseudomonas aeruginosa]
MDIKDLLRSKPVTHIETSAGRIYLYPLRMCDMTDFEKLGPGEAVSQIRRFLPSIGSLTVESDESPDRIPLDAEIASGLTDDEIERIAEAYGSSSAWQTTRESSQDRKPALREADETASAFLVRLLKAEVEEYHQSAKEMRDKMFGTARSIFDQVQNSTSIFDQVRKSTSALGSTLNAYDELTKFAKSSPPEIQPIRTDHFDALNRRMLEQARERAEERAEEMALARLTGQMTAESAKTLKDLAEAATTLMEQFDERDRKTDKSTRKQITIAVWSVGITAVLALLALIVSGFAYLQDRNNSSSGDQWQVKLLTAIEQGNQQRSAVQHENETLREQVNVLGAHIADLEAAQRAATAAAKKAEDATSPRAATNRSAAQ